jgi:glycosyltransferase involved in cell wall biosynthesis
MVFSDKTREILNLIEDNRVRVIHLEENKGLANALNIGIQNANGELIVRQDADDEIVDLLQTEGVEFNRNLFKLTNFIV